MINLNEKDIKNLGIKFVELDDKGMVKEVWGVYYHKIYNWALLGIDYCGG